MRGESEEDKSGSRRTLWVGLVALAIAAAGVWWWQRDRESTSRTEFETTRVERGDIVQSVLATGELNPVRTVQVGSQLSGIIQELLADFNSEVSKGDVVARLDPAIYEANVALAEADVERLKVAVDLARVQWERVSVLNERRMTSDAERDEARARVKQAEADYQMGLQVLKKARLELERCTIVSPVNGIVISRNVDVGQTVAASLSAPVLFEIAEDLTQMEINTFVSEADIGRVKEGQRVEFRVDAYRERTFEGYVWQVRNAPQVVDNVVSYDAVVRVENPEQILKPGMTAEVDFITGRRSDVLRVRNAALRARLPEPLLPEPPAEVESGERVVYRLVPDGALEAVAVRTGITDGMYTVALNGLSEGDVLVTGLSLQIEDDDRSGPSLLQGRQQQY